MVHAQNVLHETWPLCKGKLQHGTLKMWPLAALQRWPSYRRSFDLKCVWEGHHVAVKKGDHVIEVTVMTGLTVYAIFVRSHCILMLYSISRFSAIFKPNSHRNISASLTVPQWIAFHHSVNTSIRTCLYRNVLLIQFKCEQRIPKWCYFGMISIHKVWT